MYNYKEEKQEHHRKCEFAGCAGFGDHPAPKTKHNVGGNNSTDKYYYFCLNHVREYNKNWDYFKGMSENEIYSWQKQASLGHRPTWKHQIDPNAAEAVISHRLDAMFSNEGFSTETVGVNDFSDMLLSDRDRKALELFELKHPATKDVIKKQYKKLVKSYHPDVNRGSKQAEEHFKKITEAYEYLIRDYLENAA